MNAEKIHALKVKRAILLTSFIGLFSFLIWPSWSQRRSEEKLLLAQRQAEVLGYQVFEIYQESTDRMARTEPREALRAPSSIAGLEAGSLGSDPWGQPYKYKILKASKDQLKVQIWSAGPNRRFETADVLGVAADSYAGDDVGIVLSMAPRTP